MTKKTPVYASKEDLIANFDEVAAWAEKNYGPDVPSLTRGRPRKGEQRTPMVGKTVKLPGILWNTLKEQAKAQHTTVNSLILHRLTSL
ncbi:MAG: hypothetical protein RL318_2730 [Fibrobacterota bacterium]|jgi:hypothetical protein